MATVDALIVLGHVLIWDDHTKKQRPGSRFSLGRRFSCSSANRIQPNGDATPDLATTISVNYGIVVEAKISWHTSEFDVDEDLKQLMKYDDDLLGWHTKTKRVGKSDVVVLSHHTRKGDVLRILEKALNDEKLVMQRGLSAITFVRFSQADGEFMAFELSYGVLDEGTFQRRFLGPLTVPLE
ncbi:MAG: hypothetical protein L0Y58_15780 [Verrucomicrobia subdivision 3 bacterium]|nr:hypothetical protein [Gemmataceae bacterium]MCI0746862.1 hypothetical protein [Limisphaerales bacterium]